MNRTLLYAAAVLLPLAACSQQEAPPPTMAQTAPPQPPPAAMLSPADSTFVDHAARGGMAEVQMGQLAEQRGATQAIRRFGQRMVADHTKANDELMALAQRKQVTVPTTLDEQQAAEMQRLSGLRGRSFDRAYARLMVQDHRKDIQEFQSEAQNGSDADVKDFAQRTLPILQQHLAMARRLPSR